MPSQTARAVSRGPAQVGAPKPKPTRRVPIAVAAVVAIGLIVLLVVTAGGGGSSKKKNSSKASAGAGNASAQNAAGSQSQAGGSGAAAGATNAQGARQNDTPAANAIIPAKVIPLDVSLSNTKGLKDGDVVHIHVVPQKGSVAYGFEAWECEGGQTYTEDADVRPTFTGKCLPKPLSSDSQEYVVAPGSPPYASVDADYHVGTGTETYQMQFGETASVTCDRAHPCVLVLKLQFPNHFGIESFPLTFR
jgi:hypothetical protein